MGVSRQAVSKWETGEAMPDMEKLVALCQALELDMEYLALGKEPVPAAPEVKKPHKWIAALLAVVCFVAGVLIGHFLPWENAAEPSQLDAIEISQVTVTSMTEGVSPIQKFEIAISPNRMPESLAVAVMYGEPNLDLNPTIKVCTRDKDCYRITLEGYYDFQYRITALLTLDGQEKQIRILDIWGNEEGIEYEYIS